MLDGMATANPYAEMGEVWAALAAILSWLVSHPIGGAILAFFGFFLLWGFLRSLTYLMERLWVALLQSPWWAGRRLWTSLRSLRASPPPPPSPSDSTQGVDAILARLETLQQEQQTLLEALKSQLEERSLP